MMLKKEKMAKMDEAHIANQYSRYLQRVAIIESRNCSENTLIDQQEFLSYNEFKDYYILNLVGKGDRDYINKLVREIQQKGLPQHDH